MIVCVQNQIQMWIILRMKHAENELITNQNLFDLVVNVVIQFIYILLSLLKV